MRTTLFILAAIFCCGARALPTSATTDACHDTMIYQNPYVYGGHLPEACPVTGLSPHIMAAGQTVLGHAKYGICDYEVLIELATRNAWEKCDQLLNGVVRIGDWKFVCVDHTYGSDSGSTAEATFACL